MVTGPTYSLGNTLDLVLTTVPDRISHLLVHQELVSDHHRISFDVVQVASSHGLRRSRSFTAVDCFSRADLSGLDDYLLDADFCCVSDARDADVCCSQLCSVLVHACLLFVPQVQVPCNPLPRWFSAAIRHNINKVRSARKRVRKHPTAASEAKLLSLEQSIQTQISASNIANLVSSFSSQPSKLFRYLKDLNKSPICRPDSKVLCVPSEIACAFNGFFHSTFTRSSYVLPSREALPAPSSHLSSISIDISRGAVKT